MIRHSPKLKFSYIPYLFVYWSPYISSLGGERDSPFLGPRKAVQHSKTLSLCVPPESHTKKGSASKWGQGKSELVSSHSDTWLPLSTQSGESCHPVQTRGTTEDVRQGGQRHGYCL